MVFVYILGFIYIVAGLVYALYIMFNGIDEWYNFPLNWALGPVVMLYNYYMFNVKKRFPRSG